MKYVFTTHTYLHNLSRAKGIIRRLTPASRDAWKKVYHIRKINKHNNGLWPSTSLESCILASKRPHLNRAIAPLLDLARETISEFQKASVLKWGRVQNLSWKISFKSKRLAAILNALFILYFNSIQGSNSFWRNAIRELCCKVRKDVNFYFLNRVQRGCRVFLCTRGVLPLFKVSRLLHVNLIKCI